jgi:long-chain fatty acid transport protein
VKHRNLTCITAALLLSAPAVAAAAGWTTADRSVVAMGAGGTGAARPEDPGAAAYNPGAALAQPGLRATVGLVVANPGITAGASGGDASTSGVSTPPLAHVAWANDRFGLGASLTVPFGSRIRWPEGWAGRFALTEARVQDLRTTVYGGVRLGPVVVAAGGFFDVAELSFARNLDFIAAEGSARVDTSGTGFGGVAGIYGGHGDWSGGLSYQSRSKLAFEGWADFETPPELSRSARDQPVRTTVTLPDRLVLGAAWRGLADLTVSADLELTLWSTVDALVVTFEDEAMAPLEDQRRWRTTVTPRLGATYQALDFLVARAGLFVDPTPVPSATAGPSSPDSTRVGLSVGAGLSPLSWLTVDLAYQLVVFTGQTGENPGLPGAEYGGLAHLFGAAVAIKAL